MLLVKVLLNETQAKSPFFWKNHHLMLL